MKKVVSLCIACTLLYMAHGQTRAVKQIGVSVGVQNFKFIDQHFSPLAYSTKIVFPSIGLSYNNKNQRRQFAIQLAGASGTINPSRFGERSYSGHLNNGDSLHYDIASPFINIQIAADYLRTIKLIKQEKFSSSVGAAFNESAYYGDDIANAYWLLNIADLSAVLQVNYLPMVKHQLSARIDLAALGVITRPVYALFAKSSTDKNVAAFFKQGSRLSTIDKFQKINFHLAYQYQASQHIAIAAQYRFKWFHYTLPKQVRAVDNNFSFVFSCTI